MDGILEFAIMAFASLFTMMNPIGVIPVYISLTSHLSPKAAKKVAYKAVFNRANYSYTLCGWWKNLFLIFLQ